MLFKGEKTMRDLSIIIAFLAIVLVACGPKEKDCEKDADSTKVTDVNKSEDATELPQDATGTKAKDKKYLCYVGCLEAEKSPKDCKKACYGDQKADDCKACYDKCVKAGKKSEDCKAGCCSKTPVADAGSKPKEADAGVTLPEDVSSTKK